MTTKEKISKILEPFNDVFLEHLEVHCRMFKTIGCEANGESPRWIQYRGDKNKKDSTHDLPLTLFFQNSQNSELWIELSICDMPLPDRCVIDWHYEEVYNHFKELKYTYLKKNHPTIYY